MLAKAPAEKTSLTETRKKGLNQDFNPLIESKRMIVYYSFYRVTTVPLVCCPDNFEYSVRLNLVPKD